MTDRIIHALSRQPVHRLVRPIAAFLLAVAVAFGGGLWLTRLNRPAITDAAAFGEPGFVSTWLRDSTMMLPAVFVAVWLGLLLTRRILSRADKELSLPIGTALLAVVVGATSALATAMFAPLHALVSTSVVPGTDLPFAMHALRDALAAFPVDLAVAGVVAALIARRRPWAAPEVSAWRTAGPRGARMAFQGALILALLAPVALAAQIGTERAVAGAGPGTPCPVGAPVKLFDVTAINVDVPLNRFGDHDSAGKMYALTSMIPAIRAQESSRHVSAGLRDDPIQPLVVRANLGDCVEISFKNAAGGEFGIHIDGLAFDAASSGDAVGNNAPSSVTNGGATLYRYYVPKDPELEGAHYIRPGPGNRDAVSHGLFGTLVVEPEGSQYLHPDTGQPLQSGWGWEATIVPGNGKAFREVDLMFHEIGDEKYLIPTTSASAGGGPTLPVKDPLTTSYRPASRAINYRSEPFMHRLSVDAQDRLKAYAYNSYTFGDPVTPIPRGYIGDPMKIRLVHSGSELFHVFHLHGGGDRWRQNPHADKDYNYGDTGLSKTPVPLSSSQRLDSQSIGPGESYNLEIESGSGGAQQSAGDFLFHCHIAEHYVSGMWSVWRVYDTRQPDFAPLPDRTPLPAPVDSSGLIGRVMPDGTTLTAGNLAQWVEPQLPPKGVPMKAAGDDISLDGAVWNWRRGDANAGNANIYFGEPEDTDGAITGSPFTGSFPNLKTNADGNVHAVPGHPGLLPVDAPHQLSNDARPRILFNPTNGRPAFPLLRTQVGQRPPYTGNGHTGAPWLGEQANKPSDVAGQPDPWAGRADGLCPAGSSPRNFNIVSIQLPNQVTAKGASDQFGKVFVLAKNKDKVRNHQMPIEPLAIRANIGDCVKLSVTSEQTPDDPDQPFPMTNLHIHHVQFDPSGSDGATAGMVYGMAVRPYKLDDAQIAQVLAPNQIVVKIPATPDTTLTTLDKYRVGIWIGVGEGTENVEIRKITAVADGPNAGEKTLTLSSNLTKAHAVDEYAGTEFVQEIWYPDVVLDNIFWHDHVDGIHNWGHGLVGQLVIEPKGSTYHDPTTGAQIDSGALADIHTNNPLAPGLVDGSFREFVLWNINQNPATDATFNLKAEPLSDRRAANADPSLLYSSYTHGDPFTPLPRAYVGDPFVIRAIDVSSSVDPLKIDGHRVFSENRMRDANGNLISSSVSAFVVGVSERFTAILQGGAGGPQKRAGDYLYTNGFGRRAEQGAWGVIRVLPRQVADLQPLPGTAVPIGLSETPQKTGGRPPATTTPGEPCPAGAPQHNFAVSSVNVPGLVPGRDLAFVPTADAAAVKAGTKQPDPLVLHVAVGECVNVTFTNQQISGRASFHVDKLLRDPRSSGINIGFNPEQTVAPGGSRSYRFYADSENIGTAVISDFGGDDTGVKGLYGAVIVAPPHATFVDPVSGAATDVGTQVDVRVPGQLDYRDFSVFFSENDPFIGANTMPYPTAIGSHATINYRSAAGRALDGAQFSSLTNGDPSTPILRAYPGDPMRVHVIGAPGGEGGYVFNLGGHSWASDPRIQRAELYENQLFAPLATIDAHVRGGAGAPGDYFYGNIRRPFTDAGQWGLLRVLQPGAGPIRQLAVSPPLGQTPAARARLSGLTVAKSYSTRTLKSYGVRFGLRGDPDVRALRVKLYRMGGKRPKLVAASLITVLTPAAKARLSKAARARRSVLGVRSNGVIRVIWKPTVRQLRALRAGRYRLDVQAGPTTRTIDRQTVRRYSRITAPPRRVG